MLLTNTRQKSMVAVENNDTNQLSADYVFTRRWRAWNWKRWRSWLTGLRTVVADGSVNGFVFKEKEGKQDFLKIQSLIHTKVLIKKENNSVCSQIKSKIRLCPLFKKMLDSTWRLSLKELYIWCLSILQKIILFTKFQTRNKHCCTINSRNSMTIVSSSINDI